MKIKKENIPLIIGLSIPVVMVLVIAGAIYLPSIFIHVDPPRYSFMYMSNNTYDGYTYSVKDSHLTREKIKRKNNYSYPNPREAHIFIYNIKTHKNKELSFEEATAIPLNTHIVSEDGFKIENGRRGYGMFPFYSSGDYYTRYITKEHYSEKLQLTSGNTNYYYNFRFLGWLTKAE